MCERGLRIYPSGRTLAGLCEALGLIPNTTAKKEASKNEWMNVGDTCRLQENAMPYHIRDLNILEFGYHKEVFKPGPYGHQGIPVLDALEYLLT